MKNLILIAVLAFGVNVSAQSLQPSVVAVQPYVVMNTDSQAVVVTSEAVGVVGKTIFVALSTYEGKENIYIGNSSDSTEFKGIMVTDGGKSVVILADKVLILRPTFNSHSEADTALLSGQEYYLNGDRGVYRKP